MVCWSIQAATSVYDTKDNTTRMIVEAIPYDHKSRILDTTFTDSPALDYLLLMHVEHDCELEQLDNEDPALMIAWDEAHLYDPKYDEYHQIIGDCPFHIVQVIAQPTYTSLLDTILTTCNNVKNVPLLTVDECLVDRFAKKFLPTETRFSKYVGQSYIIVDDIKNAYPIDSWAYYDLEVMKINSPTPIINIQSESIQYEPIVLNVYEEPYGFCEFIQHLIARLIAFGKSWF